MLCTVEQDRQLCRAVFVETMRIPDYVADVAIDVLVEANLRGIDSHGVVVRANRSAGPNRLR